MKATYQNPGLYWNSWGWPHFRVECQHGTHGSKSWCNSCIYLSKTTHSYSCNLFIFLRLQWSHGFCWKVVISKWLLASNQTLTINLKIWYINQDMFILNFFGSYCLSKMNCLRFRKIILWDCFMKYFSPNKWNFHIYESHVLWEKSLIKYRMSAWYPCIKILM